MCNLTEWLTTPPKPTTNFTTKWIDGVALSNLIRSQGWSLPMGMLDNTYYYTDVEGWAEVLADLTFSSTLYKNEFFDCEDYALKAMILCTERYDLNAFGFVIGQMPQGTHGFNFFFTGDRFMLHEPNAGFNTSPYFEVKNDYGYVPQMVLV